MKHLILPFIAILLTLNSCASFSKKMIKDDLFLIKKNDLSSINGKYAVNGYQHINPDKSKNDKVMGFVRMFKIKNSNLADCDILEVRSRKIDKKQSELEFSLFKNDTLKYQFKYNAHLKKGLLLINNYNSKCTGIPYLLGGCEVFQSRIGLTKDKNLLLQNYFDNSGALLFFFWAGYTINYAEKFQKIKS